ncbi:MAG: riboflavin biosynthesis protein RibF [Clostridia bacterium]|nr:riboflavin biosynthesis protein RibF [Clostridia bacterium]
MSTRAVLGTFDGVHAGHRALFLRACELSRGDGLTVVAIVICRDGRAITDMYERVAMLRSAGAERVHLLELADVRHMSAADFVDYISREYGVRAAVCGYDFRFGRDRCGSPETLGALLPTEVVPEQRIDGVTVSSTAIREALAQGRMEDAAKLLGRPYRLTGAVTHGKRLGSTRGYPTANIPYPDGRAQLARGVYFTRVILGERSFNAVSNLGVCPTVQGEDTVVENHLLDFDGSLYGEQITVEFLHYLRGEERFPDVDALYGRIAADTELAREYFNKREEK